MEWKAGVFNMTEHEFMLFDRVEKARQIIAKYGEENFEISFSGGKDSTTLHYFIDYAIPGNRIIRRFANTGIEFLETVKFVKSLAAKDDRIVIVNQKRNIKKTLEKYGYPFKSKEFSRVVPGSWNGKIGDTNQLKKILSGRFHKLTISKKLMPIINTPFCFNMSDNCCKLLKENVLDKNGKIRITAIRREEGGRRAGAVCLAFAGKKLKRFNIFAPVSNDFMKYLAEKLQIQFSALYYPPYNFERTGCKGCPFNPRLQKELEVLKKFAPAEYRQCWYLWRPVYELYQKLNYRLKKPSDYEQMELL